jgi:hypothetical protein
VKASRSERKGGPAVITLQRVKGARICQVAISLAVLPGSLEKGPRLSLCLKVGGPAFFREEKLTNVKATSRRLQARSYLLAGSPRRCMCQMAQYFEDLDILTTLL